jgi:hypothetical protein
MKNKIKENHDTDIERIKLMITVLNRGLSDVLIKELRSLGITFNMASVGYKASGLELADYFGLTEKECDIVFSVVPESKVKTVLHMVEFKFSLNEPGTGASICVPISGVGGPVSLKYISGIDVIKEDAR